MLGIIFEIICARHVPYAMKGGSREGFLSEEHVFFAPHAPQGMT